MEKGINLNLSKSLIDFDKLPGLSVQAVSAKKFSLQEKYGNMAFSGWKIYPNRKWQF